MAYTYRYAVVEDLMKMEELDQKHSEEVEKYFYPLSREKREKLIRMSAMAVAEFSNKIVGYTTAYSPSDKDLKWSLLQQYKVVGSLRNVVRENWLVNGKLLARDNPEASFPEPTIDDTIVILSRTLIDKDHRSANVTFSLGIFLITNFYQKNFVERRYL